MTIKMTRREKSLAKRAGKGGTAWIEARRKTPGLTLLEFQTLTAQEGSDLGELDLPTTTDADPAPAKKTTAKKTAAKKASGSSAPK